MDKKGMIKQTGLAFDYIQKLYYEVSYLIKELEGILSEEKEEFIIGRPSGYSINTRSSTGLEASNVKLWLLRKFAVFFIPKDKTDIKGGQTITEISKNLKILYVRIVLNDEEGDEPTIYSGGLYNIHKKPHVKWIKKFEHIMNHLEYNDNKVFSDAKKIDYEDSYIKLQGKLIKNRLFEINNSEAILEKIIKPSLDIYRGI